MPFSFFTKKSNSFSGNVLKLMTGTVLAQALGILVMPVVTRLFAPEAFGIAAIFSSMTGIIGVVVCLRYELAIMLPESHAEAANILGVSLLSVVIMTVVSTIVICCFSETIITLLKAPQLESYLWLVPVAIFIQGIFLALNYWNTRTKHYGRLSIAQVVSSVTAQTAKLAAGFSGFVSGGVLICTGLLGSIVSTTILGGQIWRDDKKIFSENIRWRAIFDGCVRFRKFPIFDVWGGLMNSISWQLPALMLSSFFSIAIVGYYALALAIIKAPLGIIAGALSQVFYQKACDGKSEKGANGKLVEKLMDSLVFISLLPVLVLALVGEEVFIVIFGQSWLDAGKYTQILSPWIFFWFISSPLSTLFSVFERQGSGLSVHSLILLTRFISLYIGGLYQNIYLALGLFSATGILAYGFVAAWNIKLAKANGRKILINTLKYVLYSLPVCFCLILVKYVYHFNSIFILVSAILLIIGYYYLQRDKLYALYKA